MRGMLAWLLSLAATVAFTCWAISTSPEFEKCAASEYRPQKQESADNPPPRTLAFTDSVALYARCEGHVLYEYRDAITAVSTAFIALFTLTLWLSTWGLLRATNQSIRLARDEFISTHRPLLKVKFVHMDTKDGYVALMFSVPATRLSLEAPLT
jgi:hypothetical protein